ncbi:MAG TPA: acyl-CoA dehydrogenase family protein [Jatrophihabitans sp.]|jgi:hypothetical protein
MSVDRSVITEWAKPLLDTGRASELVDDLVTSGMADEVWADPGSAGALFELQGSSGATSRLLDAYVLQPGPQSALSAFLLPLPGTAVPPAQVRGREIAVDGLTVGGCEDAPVVMWTDSDDVLAMDRLRVEGVPGFDPELRLLRWSGTVTLDDCAALPLAGDILIARAARALAHQLLGTASLARTIATRHVLDRHQFGRPIGAFQSVRHRLADAFIAETGARELLENAGEPIDAVRERLLLKAGAGRAALLAVQAAQQVCGAMGFTAEFGLHRVVRRAYVLDALLGGSEEAEFDLAAQALATGRVPLPVPL